MVAGGVSPTTAVLRSADEKRRLDALNAAAQTATNSSLDGMTTESILGRAREFEAYLRGDGG